MDNNENTWEQGFFWNNFPTKPKKNLHFTSDYAIDTVLSSMTYPYILYTGIHSLPFRLIEKDSNIISGLKKIGILHIYLLEPVSYYVEPINYNHGYYSEFHDSKNKLARCTEIESISEFAKRHNIKIIVHTCDYKFKEYYQKYYPQLDIICDDLFLKLHTRPPRNVYFKKDITTKFYCVNGRYTPHRHMIMSYLTDKNGHYVWRFKGSMEKIKNEIEWVDESLPWNYLIQNNKILNNSYFALDIEFDHIQINNFQGDGVLNTTNCHTELINDLNNQVFCFVVNETRFAQPTGNISEKTFQAVNSLSPFVLVAPPRSLEYFKKLGFKTFSDFWDESYDLEENHAARMNKIFEVIDYINNKSIKELKTMYKKMSPILKYNAKRMHQFRFLNFTIRK